MSLFVVHANSVALLAKKKRKRKKKEKGMKQKMWEEEQKLGKILYQRDANYVMKDATQTSMIIYANLYHAHR